MTEELICELNLALIPEESLANRHIALSRQMATRYPPLIELNGVRPRLAFTPHLTLYQVRSGFRTCLRSAPRSRL